MKFHVILLMVFLLVLIVSANNVKVDWIGYTFSSGLYCTGLLEKLAPCHLVAHWVFYVFPSNGLRLIQGVTEISLDNENDFFSYGDIHYEQHGFNVSITDDDSMKKDVRGQVYNIQFQRTYLDPDSVPSSICAKGTILNDPDEQLFLPNACVEVDKSHMWFEGNTIERSWYLHGNATRECSLVENRCRVMAHVVIRTSTVIGGPLARLAGGGEYSLDGGQTWESKGNHGLQFEAQMIMHSDGQLYQGLNWGFDLEMSLESPVGDICWKIWTTNTMSASEPAWVDMGEDDGGYMGYQISKYERCFTPELVIDDI